MGVGYCVLPFMSKRAETWMLAGGEAGKEAT
jgi:hypothetical protein